MARKVVAIYMHEAERDAAKSAMTGAKVAESFVYGDADDAAIERMRAQGLVVVPQDEPQQPDSGVFGFAPPAPAARRPRAAAGPPGPGWYLVKLDGPLMEPWKNQLSRIKVSLRDRTGSNEYRARLSPMQSEKLGQLPYVRSVRVEAPPRRPRMAAAPGAPQRGIVPMLELDLLLDSEAQMRPVRKWLEQHHVAIGGVAKRKIRIYLLEGSPLRDELDQLPGVTAVEEYVRPKLANDRARLLLRVDRAASPAAPALKQQGDGEIVAIADTGVDHEHPDLKKRLVDRVALGRSGNTSDPDGHGTHVAGSAVGDGTASSGAIRGTAPKARLYFQSIMDDAGELTGLPISLGDLFQPAYDAGARVHNNSWGAATRSTYRAHALEADEFVREHRDMTLVFAAGNEGVGDPLVKARPGFIEWTSLSSPATCKNAITVGASRSDRGLHGYSAQTYGGLWPAKYPHDPCKSAKVSGDPESMAAFSSRGPCDDMRIKPDLVAPGTDIASARSSIAPLWKFWGDLPGLPHYALNGGTSMAAPLVAGCAALVREYYRKLSKPHQPSAALVKATLINSTRWLTGADSIADHPEPPNYHQGFGALDMGNCIPNPAEPGLTLQFIDNWQDTGAWFTRTGQRARFRFKAKKGRALRICLAYTDPASRALVNNLNLLAQLDGEPRKWLGNADIPNSIGIPDTFNNVEVIRIDPPRDATWLIQVFAHNLLQSGQDFAVVVTGAGVTPLEVF